MGGKDDDRRGQRANCEGVDDIPPHHGCAQGASDEQAEADKDPPGDNGSAKGMPTAACGQ